MTHYLWHLIYANEGNFSINPARIDLNLLRSYQ